MRLSIELKAILTPISFTKKIFASEENEILEETFVNDEVMNVSSPNVSVVKVDRRIRWGIDDDYLDDKEYRRDSI